MKKMKINDKLYVLQHEDEATFELIDGELKEENKMEDIIRRMDSTLNEIYEMVKH